MRTAKLLLVLAVSGCTVMPAKAQPPRLPDRAQFVQLEAIPFLASDSGPARVDILYRMERTFFVATRSLDSSADAPFRRSGQILMELFDSTDASQARSIETVDIPEVRSEIGPGEKAWHEGVVSFRVPQGNYRIFFEATDLNSSRRYVHPPMSVRTLPPPVKPPSIGAWFFAQAPDTAGIPGVRPENFGGDMLFGVSSGVLAEVAPGDTSARSADVVWSLSVLEPGEESGKRYAGDTLRALPLRTGFAVEPEKRKNGVRYVFTSAGSSRTALLSIPLPTATLPLRLYALSFEVTVGGRSVSATRKFRNVWPEMPMSLKNVDNAIEALRFITSENTLDSLKSGNFEQRRDALEEFWNRRNKTPATARNELMTEYYRRIDVATREYATLREQDGTKTDRGRIFVLNGPPARLDRTLSPTAGFTEIWFYERPARTFTFVDENKNGTYILKSATP
jgi:GWxTD domain-containing protein